MLLEVAVCLTPNTPCSSCERHIQMWYKTMHTTCSEARLQRLPQSGALPGPTPLRKRVRRGRS